MEALVYTGPEQMEVQALPEPEPTDGVAVRVALCGICGSDMHAYLGHDPRRPAPLVLGHEAVGTVMDGPLAGRRVAINPLVTCGRCPACTGGRSNLCPHRQIISMPPRPGAFAETVQIPERNVVVVPDGVADWRAALTEPFATSYHAVVLGASRLHRPIGAGPVAVLGGGAIGLAAAFVARALGAGQIAVVEPAANRLAVLANVPGFSVLADAGELEAGDWPLVIDAVGIGPTRAAASRLVAPGGVIVHVGLGGGSDGLDVRRFTLQEITFIGVYTYTMADFTETLGLLATDAFGIGAAQPAWVDVRPLRAGADAFAALKSGAVAQSKVMLAPGA